MAGGTALVTGATGFIGRWAAQALLDRGYVVHCVAGPQGAVIPAELAGTRVHRMDLFDRGAMKSLIKDVKPSQLAHFAWVTTPGAYGTSPDNVSWTAASLDLLRAFRDSGGERFVGAGSCAEYDWSQAGICSEASTPLVTEAKSAGSLYAVAKVSFYRLASAYALQSGLSFAWGRIFFQFGPYEHPKRLVASVIISLLKGEAAHCTHGRQVRGFLASMDVGAASAALVASKVEGAVNISTTERQSLAELVTKIGDLIGRPELIRLGARQAPAGEPPLLVADTSRLTSEVGWRPAETLDSGLTKTIDWWRANLAASR